MKRRILFSLFVIVTSLSSYGQKYDYTWMAGYLSKVYDSTYHHWFGISRLDFNYPAVQITLDSLHMNFESSNSIISDADGNLLFYCNGIAINNRYDERIADSLSAIDSSYFLFQYGQNAFTFGIPADQYHVVLPNPTNPSIYDVLYLFIDSFHVPGGLNLEGTKILKATVDVEANAGHGKVYNKNKLVLNGENNICLAAVRHANGKDWWLTSNKASSNCYNILLYTGADSLANQSSCGGTVETKGQSVTMRFSPDGGKFITACTNDSNVNVFDFDRCNGTVTLIETVSIPELVDSFQWWPSAIEFSPDSRFMYVFCTFRVYQFDMQASPIVNSRITIGVYDKTHRCPFYQTFSHAQLAPDGKIYMSSGNSNYCIGVVDNPNGQGTSCNFNDTAINLPTFISGLPYYPNYRLGALPGSPCDTLTGLNETARALKEKILKVFPNPAGNMVTVDYGFTDWSRNGDVKLVMSDESGRVVLEQTLPKYSGFQNINVSSLAAGSYFVYLKRNGNTIAGEKMMKE